MGIFGKYFDVEKGLKKPSASLKAIARIGYIVELILGIIGSVWCLIQTIIIYSEYEELSPIILGVVLAPLAAKLSGWLFALAIRSFSVIVESHEKNLGIEKEEEKIVTEDKNTAIDKLSGFKLSNQGSSDDDQNGWWCEYCGKKNSNAENVCWSCGKTRR